ncbi:MAG: hypothetical protein IJS22_01360 [Lachnospiraceae bacterium]|nr:hypothetical protein [Lachnospiraceae bacterium]
MIKDYFDHWLDGECDPTRDIYEIARVPDASRSELKDMARKSREEIASRDTTRSAISAQKKGFYAIYTIVAIVSCIALIGVLLYSVSLLPQYGRVNPRAAAVVERYIEDGVAETGAINIVSGIILDYRAFDTLGESHVLFTALLCVMVLLRMDSKNMRNKKEDYALMMHENFFDLSHDGIIRTVAKVLLPSLLVFGAYVLLNGQNSPGGGFSGGSILGATLIIAASSFGLSRIGNVFTRRASECATFISLSFYSFAKGYVFFTGANGLENHIPKGTPGAILSGGLILPLDIAVGIVVTCTMFGFYSLFRKGMIGNDN